MDMNHGSSTMNMVMTTAMSMPTGTSDMAGMSGMSGMGATSTAKPAMSMGGMGNGCKISMLWNWNTVDSCFISSSWKITSPGMMAGSCIGVILLVMTLELLRRAAKEYDNYLIRTASASPATTAAAASSSSYSSDNNGNGTAKTAGVAITSSHPLPIRKKLRPTIFQQATRASLHMAQFTVAYFVMLLAMYYNGYIIICIIIGAWLGSFVFSWGNLDVGGPKEDSTYCCG